MNGFAKKVLIIFVALLLILFVLHDIHLDHDHPEHLYGHDVEGHLFASEESLSALFIAGIVALMWKFHGTKLTEYINFQSILYKYTLPSAIGLISLKFLERRIFHPEFSGLKRGIIHSKVFD